jgi:hypothetical protein
METGSRRKEAGERKKKNEGVSKGSSPVIAKAQPEAIQ